MFRTIPNGCTSRNMGKYGRAGPRIKRGRGDPASHLHLVSKQNRDMEFEEIEKLIFNNTHKEGIS